MKKVNMDEMRNINGGWYFGKVTCSICGRKLNPTLIQRIAYDKTTLQNFGMAAHGYNFAFGTKIKH